MAEDADRDDKTEAASPKRQLQARAEGRAPLSREVAGLAVLGSGAALISTMLPAQIGYSLQALTALIAQSGSMSLNAGLHLAARTLLTLVWPFCAASVLAASLAVLGQTRFLLKQSAIGLHFDRINPAAGLARLLGPHALMEAGKSVLKVVIMSLVCWTAWRDLAPQLLSAFDLEPAGLAEQIARTAIGIATSVLAVQALIAGADMLREQLSFHASLRMTRHELREEAREQEGDPHVKARVRQIRMQRSRRRMLAAVPKAAVVVTNPTHYAVALAYERGAGGAPRIVAKGMDDAAFRIRALARKSGVPVVANPPLARALYPLKLDCEIPPEHFKVVAELIAYVWRLQGRNRRSRL